MAPHPPRQPLDGAAPANGRSSATASPAASTPRPDGAPGSGLARSTRRSPPSSRDGSAPRAAAAPWCTTVSFVNPHDIAWWYVLERPRAGGGGLAARRSAACPRTSRRPQQLTERRKPRLQRSLQDTAAASFGPVPFTRPGRAGRGCPSSTSTPSSSARSTATSGACSRRSRAGREMAANTVVVFTSDHGEYGASHGLRGKGAGVYEEAIRVPLIVNDPRGQLTRCPEQVRTQLTSSVDVAPLLLTIATGSDDWRSDPHYSHIAGRARPARDPRRPAGPGRDLCAARDRRGRDRVRAPALCGRRAAARRRRCAPPTPSTRPTRTGPKKASTPLAAGQEAELYDYRTHGGRLEIDNVAGRERAREPDARDSSSTPSRSELRAAAAEPPARSARARVRRLLLDREGRGAGGDRCKRRRVEKRGRPRSHGLRRAAAGEGAAPL